MLSASDYYSIVSYLVHMIIRFLFNRIILKVNNMISTSRVYIESKMSNELNISIGFNAR